MVNIAVTSVLNNAKKIGLASGILAGYGYGPVERWITRNKNNFSFS